MRPILLFLVLATCSLSAQSKREVTPLAGGGEFVTRLPFGGFLPIRDGSRGAQLGLRPLRDVFRADAFLATTPNSLLTLSGLERTPAGPVFDFTQARPHLAFFCRLEINEAANAVIPARFRLGGHRYWQDDLRRR